MNTFKNNFIVEKIDSYDPEENTIVSVISTNSLNRNNWIINTAGINVNEYLQSPIVLLNHDVNTIIGKNLWLKIEDDKIIAKTKFANTSKGKEISYLWGNGFANGWSIKVVADEKNVKINSNNVKYVDKSIMDEYSAATRQADLKAVSMCLENCKDSQLIELFLEEKEKMELQEKFLFFENEFKKFNEIKYVKEDEIEKLNDKINMLNETIEQLKDTKSNTSYKNDIIEKLNALANKKW